MVSPKQTIKFLCSYRGKILPRYPDGKLRYQGGETRVLAVHRSISFSELLLKMGEMYGTSVSLRCQLPTDDLDALVSITSDEELEYVIEEYEVRLASAASFLKIRAFLSVPKSNRKPINSPPSPSPSSSYSSSSSLSSSLTSSSNSSYSSSASRFSCICQRQSPRFPVASPDCSKKSAANGIGYYGYRVHQGNHIYIYHIQNGKHWQWR